MGRAEAVVGEMVPAARFLPVWVRIALGIEAQFRWSGELVMGNGQMGYMLNWKPEPKGWSPDRTATGDMAYGVVVTEHEVAQQGVPPEVAVGRAVASVVLG